MPDLPDWLAPLVTYPLSTGQAQALTRLATDIRDRGVQGPEANLQSSTLLRHLNQGNLQVARAEFVKWCLVNGRISARQLSNRQEDSRSFKD
jgi:GH24 family phage-related lysozyme (muramidase)